MTVDQYEIIFFSEYTEVTCYQDWTKFRGTKIYNFLWILTALSPFPYEEVKAKAFQSRSQVPYLFSSGANLDHD